MVKVSIIIPVYKTEARLGACLDSVLNQTYHDWELILVDNGGVDRCPEICDAYAQKDSRLKVVHLRENVGIGGARNVGLKHVSGAYVQFMDSDDFAEPEMLAANMKIMLEKQCDIIFRPAKMVFTYNNTEKIIARYSNLNGNLSFGERLIQMDREGCLFSIWDKFYKVSIIREHHLEFDPDVITGDDCVFNYNYLCYAKEGYYDDTPYYSWYQWSDTQSSRKVQTPESITRWLQSLSVFYAKYAKTQAQKKNFSDKFYILLSYLIPGNRAPDLHKKIFKIAASYRQQLYRPNDVGSLKIKLMAWCIYLNVPLLLRILLGLRGGQK